jgi:alkylhydroperoxidase family enzyme
MSRISHRKGGLIARGSAWYARRMYGKVPDPVLVTAHNPAVLRGYLAFEWELGRASRVDERLRNLGEMKMGALVGCEFCLDIGSMISRKSGVTEAQLLDLPRYRESEHFSYLERLVLDYATAMAQTPVDVSDELFAALREHLDEAQLVELTAAIAWEGYRSRFNHALGLEPQGYTRGACAVPERPLAAASP